jgi:hypothetical protein
MYLLTGDDDFDRLDGPGILAALALPLVLLQVSEGASPTHQLATCLVALEVNVVLRGDAARSRGSLMRFCLGGVLGEAGFQGCKLFREVFRLLVLYL